MDFICVIIGLDWKLREHDQPCHQPHCSRVTRTVIRGMTAGLKLSTQLHSCTAAQLGVLTQKVEWSQVINERLLPLTCVVHVL